MSTLERYQYSLHQERLKKHVHCKVYIRNTRYIYILLDITRIQTALHHVYMMQAPIYVYVNS